MIRKKIFAFIYTEYYKVNSFRIFFHITNITKGRTSKYKQRTKDKELIVCESNAQPTSFINEEKKIAFL